MTKRPCKPQSPLSWNIYRAAKKAVWVGMVEAADADKAIEKAAKQYKVPAYNLIAVRR
jgi:hypothetical protein